MAGLVVPLYVPGQVTQTPLSPARATNVDVAAGAEMIGQGLGNDAKSVSLMEQQAAQHRDMLDETAARDLDNQLAAQHRTILYGDGTAQNPGFLSLSGKDALSARAGTEAALEAAQKNIVGQASTPQQQRLFAQVASQRTETALDQVDKVMPQRLKEYTDATQAAAQANAEDAAAAAGSVDPETYTKQMATVKAAAAQIVTGNLGSDTTDPGIKAAIEQATMEATTRVHSTIIAGMLKTDPQAAEDWLVSHAAEISTPAFDKMKDIVADQTNSFAAIKDAASAFAQSMDPKTGMLNETELYAKRDAYVVAHPRANLAFTSETEKRVSQYHQAATADGASAFLQAQAEVINGTPPALLDGALKSRLVAAGKYDDILTFGDHLRTAGLPPKNGGTYMALVQLSADPNKKAEWLHTNLTDPRIVNSIDPGELAELMKAQGSGKDTWGAALQPTVQRAMDQLLPQLQLLKGGQYPVATSQKDALKAKAQTFVLGEMRRLQTEGVNIDDPKQITTVVARALAPSEDGTKGGLFFESAAAGLWQQDPQHYNTLRQNLGAAMGIDPGHVQRGDIIHAFNQRAAGKPVAAYKDIPAVTRGKLEAYLNQAHPGKAVAHSDVENAYSRFLFGDQAQ